MDMEGVEEQEIGLLKLMMQGDMVQSGLSETQVKKLPSGYFGKQAFMSAFKSDPEVRRQTMVDNADNIAFLVYALSHEYERLNAPPPSDFFGRLKNWFRGAF